MQPSKLPTIPEIHSISGAPFPTRVIPPSINISSINSADVPAGYNNINSLNSHSPPLSLCDRAKAARKELSHKQQCCLLSTLLIIIAICLFGFLPFLYLAIYISLLFFIVDVIIAITFIASCAALKIMYG